MIEQLRRWFLKRAPRHTAEAPSESLDIKEIFSSIYHKNYWGNRDSRSGAGSDLTQTAVIRERLPVLIRKLGVDSMIDVPCGDFFWMAQTPIDCDYLGADVVPEMIAHNQAVFGSVRRSFRVLDVTSDELPRADLIFSRDLLVHFSFSDIARALHRMQASGAAWLLTTTFTGRNENLDIPTGLWRPLNFVRPPFSFPEPVEVIIEGCTEGDGSWGDKSLGLWRLPELPISALLVRCGAKSAAGGPAHE